MNLSELDYSLPAELIAQRPIGRRDDSRLLVYERASGEVRHRRFSELPEELERDELVVVNDSRVIPARIPIEQPRGEVLLPERIRAARRVLAVGTTTVRVLESLARGAPLAGRTDLFVTPGFEFRRADSLLTNFHLPRSTLLALVMAFAGVRETRRIYALAIEDRYRFYSFGDAMLIR